MVNVLSHRLNADNVCCDQAGNNTANDRLLVIQPLAHVRTANLWNRLGKNFIDVRRFCCSHAVPVVDWFTYTFTSSCDNQFRAIAAKELGWTVVVGTLNVSRTTTNQFQFD
ncbi:hypothetical protein D3C87_1338110 [compost metagenome]